MLQSAAADFTREYSLQRNIIIQLATRRLTVEAMAKVVAGIMKLTAFYCPWAIKAAWLIPDTYPTVPVTPVIAIIKCGMVR